MLKSAQSSFFKKRKNLENKKEKIKDKQEILNEFLKTNYPEELLKTLNVSLDFIPRQNIFLIQTNSKAFANDLVLKKEKIEKLFSKKVLIKG